MPDIESQNMPNQNEMPGGNFGDYTARAAEACAAGDMVLGMHLYLAAYEKGMAEDQTSDDAAIDSLREAWHLACDLKERSMAEYVFEKLEPYLTGDEVQDCASTLQNLALDRLEEYGFSRDELEGMAQMITGDLLAGGASILQIDQISIPHRAPVSRPSDPEPLDAPVQTEGEASESTGDHPAESEGDSTLEALKEVVREGVPLGNGLVVDSEGRVVLSANLPAAEQGTDAAGDPAPAKAEEKIPGAPADPASTEKLTYKNLVGYDETVGIMRDFGVGMHDDPEFVRFVQMLNRRHGLYAMPSLDSLLFRAVAREDAARFVEATIGELGLPSLRMTMEENIQGIPILCVTTQSDNQPRLNQARNRFEGPAILVIEDLDLWTVPQMPEPTDGLGGFMMANISRGARAAFDLVRAAVEDPDVFVLATAQLGEESDPFFYDMLEPLSVIDIGYPTNKERRDIWHAIVQAHPSMRGIDRYDLMRFSAGMPRYDIYMAAREALEEAYKMGLMAREFVPVTPQNIFEKLAACQPLGSEEYLALEEAVLKDFRRDLDRLEDLLGDE